MLGGAQIIAFAGLIETTGFFQATSTTDGRGPREGGFSMKDSTESAEPGNYGVGFPNFLGKVEDPEARKSKLAAELANGRLATDDCHHCQPAVCQLRCKLALASLRVLDLAQEVGETNAIIAWLSRLSGILHAEATLTRTTAISGRSCLEESSCLDQTSEGNDLSATQHWEP